MLDRATVECMGFASVGENVFISGLASFYNCANISLGNNVRIDDFCVISAGEGGITIGSYVHIAVYSSLMGNALIKLEDYSGLSSRVSIYSSNDDYSGKYMTNPTVPQKYTNVSEAPVIVKRHVIIGAGSIILPGVTLHEGASVGALSLIKKDCEAFCTYFGLPAKKVGRRSKRLLEVEKDLLGKLD